MKLTRREFLRGAVGWGGLFRRMIAREGRRLPTRPGFELSWCRTTRTGKGGAVCRGTAATRFAPGKGRTRLVFSDRDNIDFTSYAAIKSA